MYDVSFLVGKDGGAKRSVQANSTILALRSEYFRAMCFGPMRNDREKVRKDSYGGSFCQTKKPFFPPSSSRSSLT